MRLILARHAAPEYGTTGAIQSGPPGPDLSAEGREQAAALADALTGEPIDAVFVSSLPRTAQTAEPLARLRGLTPVVQSGLDEIFAGDLEGSTEPASLQAYLDVILAWVAGDQAVRMPGADDGFAFMTRLDEAVAAIEAAGEHPLVVAHGGTLWVWAALRTTNGDPTFLRERQLPPTGLVVVEGSSADGWTLLSWGEEPVPPRS